MSTEFKISNLPKTAINTLALGVFDGVHRGHDVIISKSDYVLSLSPHPDIVLNKCPELQLLSTPREFQLLIPHSAILHFTAEISQLSPQDFLEKIVLDKFQPQHIIAGYDYRFGARGQGDISFLKSWGDQNKVIVTEVSPQAHNGDYVKSSVIRGHLLNGDFSTALELLGHSYLMSGEVVHGAGKGSELGFPTANLEFEDYKLLPRSGVYYGLGIVDNSSYPLLLNIGTAPTLGGGQQKVEAHLLDFSGDIYGKLVHVYLEGYLRAEQKFSSIDDLISQIQRDELQVREILSA